jgi:uncharacterized protein
MRCLKSGPRYLLRLERGEEILDSVRAFVRREGVPGASVTGLGAVDDVTVAFYDLDAKTYRNYRHRGLIEILNLTGNIAWRGTDPVVHIHVSAAHETEGGFGGHLVAGVVSATIEIGVDPYEGRIERAFDAEVGLPLLDLPPRRAV